MSQVLFTSIAAALRRIAGHRSAGRRRSDRSRSRRQARFARRAHHWQPTQSAEAFGSRAERAAEVIALRDFNSLKLRRQSAVPTGAICLLMLSQGPGAFHRNLSSVVSKAV
jgi:hypothetical protein